MLVFKNKYGKFQTPCNSKDKNNNNITYWMYVNFKKGTEPIDRKTSIRPVKYWFNCFEGTTKAKDQNGNEVTLSVLHPTLFINEWDIESTPMITPDGKETSVEEYQSEKSKQLNINAEELPFY